MLTPCGHSFCHDCIAEALSVSVFCPECRCDLSFADLQPNFALDTMIRGQQASIVIEDDDQYQPATLNELNRRIALLMEQRNKLANDQALVDGQMLVDFLQSHLKQRHQDLKRLQDEVSHLELDLSKASESLLRAKQRAGWEEEPEVVEIENPAAITTPVEGEPEVPVSRKRKLTNLGHEPLTSIQVPADCQRRMEELKSELASSYRQAQREEGGLDIFARRLRSLCRLTRLRTVANLRLSDINASGSSNSSSNIISSIEFDRDAAVFVTAGVSKKIRFYRYADVIANGGSVVQMPLREIATKSKLSSVSWNQYMEHHLAGGDYEGIATVWDVAKGGQVVCTFEEHEKRIWSVDYSRVDPMRLATGSDDAHVRVWSGRTKKSTMVIDGKANVCSVAFHPTQSHLLAFGSADHHVHIYDLRSTLRPLRLLKGHRKAVSYVKWMGEQEIVSASTDCQLRLWQQQQQQQQQDSWDCKQIFSGHVNEKNFVGLAVHQDLIACGSENNSLYCYHRDLTSPLASLRFTQTCPISGVELESDGQHFVSAVCWRNVGDGQLVVANSQGAVKIVQLE